MLKKLPPGDPILALDDTEFGVLQDFSLAMLERGAPVTEEQMNLLAGLLYWTRERVVAPVDFTGHTIAWRTAGGETCVADCLSQADGVCHTELGLVDSRWVNLLVQGTRMEIGWPPKERT